MSAARQYLVMARDLSYMSVDKVRTVLDTGKLTEHKTKTTLLGRPFRNSRNPLGIRPLLQDFGSLFLW